MDFTEEKGELSAPPQISHKISIPFVSFLILLGILMPLFGASLIAVVLIEFIILGWQTKKKLRAEEVK